MNHLIRTVVCSPLLAALIACGSDEPPPPPPPPFAIQSVTPSSVGARTADFRVQVFGTGLRVESVILLDGAELRLGAGRVIGSGVSYLGAWIPGGTVGTTAPGRLSVSVKNPDGTRSNEVPLVVTEAPAPVLAAISTPGSSKWCDPGEDSFVLDVSGANFTTDTSLELNGQALSIFRRTASSLRFTVTRAELLSAPGSLKVTVPAPGGGEAVGHLSPPINCED